MRFESLSLVRPNLIFLELLRGLLIAKHLKSVGGTVLLGMWDVWNCIFLVVTLLQKADGLVSRVGKVRFRL
jgi:hypothetical protein